MSDNIFKDNSKVGKNDINLFEHLFNNQITNDKIFPKKIKDNLKDDYLDTDTKYDVDDNALEGKHLS